MYMKKDYFAPETETARLSCPDAILSGSIAGGNEDYVSSGEEQIWW